ncbi:hypothetical protein WJX77_008187 [Trebouxia sp. C0004]
MCIIRSPADYFGNDIFRQVIYKAWPLSKSQLQARSIYVDPHDNIELTAHQVAFVDVKVRSLFSGQQQIAHHGAQQDEMIAQCMVSDLQRETFSSSFVTIVGLGPTTPT